MQHRIDAVIFDLYDTLIRIKKPIIHREIPRTLGVSIRPWMQLVRERLMTTPFSGRDELVRFICDSLAPDCGPELASRCASAVDLEMESIEPARGVHSLLAFLKRRGFKLGLLSNLTSVHKEPLVSLELDQYFDATGLSCDEGRLKPQPEIYLDLCARLGVEPASVLVVGDSLRNDVLAPLELGMHALQVGRRREQPGIDAVSDLGWVLLEQEPASILGTGATIRLGDSEGVIREFTPLGDTEQGRFNLVAEAAVELRDAGPRSNTSSETRVFCKRFLFPEAAYVEAFAHGLMADIELPSCETFVSATPEPSLVVTKARGNKYEGDADPPLAFELGRHCAAGYLFSNADLRPRNAFLSYEGSRPVVTMVDLEHCLFNLALDTAGLEDPFRPDTFDRLPDSELAGRVRRQVLTDRSTRRAMGTFLKLESLESELAVAFRRGWVATFRKVQSICDPLCRRIDERIHTEPYLVIGTRSYRRSMAAIDVEDIRSRINQDPEELFPRLAAVQRGASSSSAGA